MASQGRGGARIRPDQMQCIYLAAADELEDAVDPCVDGGAPLLNDPGSAGPRGSSHGSPPPAHRRDAPTLAASGVWGRGLGREESAQTRDVGRVYNYFSS